MQQGYIYILGFAVWLFPGLLFAQGDFSSQIEGNRDSKTIPAIRGCFQRAWLDVVPRPCTLRGEKDFPAAADLFGLTSRDEMQTLERTDR
jgi:hypothetical protein